MKNDINQLIDALVLEERNTGFNPYISTRIMVAVENQHNKIVFPFSPFWKTAVVGLSMIAAVFTGVQSQATLVFFLSPTCPVCKKLLPVLKAVARDEQQHLRVILASDGEQASHLQFVREYALDALPYVLSTDLGMGYRVSRLPYAVVLDKQGVVAAKGLVNSREQLDSLLNAHEMGQASIQQYLGGNAA